MELDETADLLGFERSELVRRALDEGIRELRIRAPIQEYQSGELSVNQAARLAGTSVAEWLELARNRNLTSQLRPEDLDRDAESARDL